MKTNLFVLIFLSFLLLQSCLFAIRKDQLYKFSYNEMNLPEHLIHFSIYLTPEKNDWFVIPPVAFSSGKGPYTACINTYQDRDSLRYSTIQIDSIVVTDSNEVYLNSFLDSSIVYNYDSLSFQVIQECFKKGIQIDNEFININTYGYLFKTDGSTIRFHIIQKGYRDREWSYSSIFELAG